MEVALLGPLEVSGATGLIPYHRPQGARWRSRRSPSGGGEVVSNERLIERAAGG